MSEWEEYILADIAKLKKERWKVGDESSPYIGLQHIEEKKLRLNGVGSSEEINSNKYRFNAGDTLFGKLRPYFRKVAQPNFDGICSTDIWVVQPKEGVDADFLFYFFANEELVNLSYASSSGTRMPRADWGFLKETKWPLSSLPEQKAIASVLSSLDDKIDLLYRHNQTLEAMAETLFRQWFVERRPEPVEEEAEEDWEEVSLYDSIDLIGGGTPKTSIDEYWDGDINWLSGGDIASNHKNFVTSTERSITQVGLQNSSATLLPKYSTVISARGTVGKYCLLSDEMTFSQSNYGIKPKFDDCYFFTYLLIAHSVERLKSAASGSVFDTITTKTFKTIRSKFHLRII